MAVGVAGLIVAVGAAGLATFGTGVGTITTGFGVGVGVGTTPASTRGKSRTTASRVGSGVGWWSATTSAEEAFGPPPHAAQNSAQRTRSQRIQSMLGSKMRPVGSG